MTEISSQIRLLSNAIKVTNENHRVLSQNIANINTPGYKTQRLDFKSAMEKLRENDSGTNLNLEVIREEGLPERMDRNNVDLEREMSELKKNSLMAETYTQLVAAKLATMRRAISG